LPPAQRPSVATIVRWDRHPEAACSELLVYVSYCAFRGGAGTLRGCRSVYRANRAATRTFLRSYSLTRCRHSSTSKARRTDLHLLATDPGQHEPIAKVGMAYRDQVQREHTIAFRKRQRQNSSKSANAPVMSKKARDRIASLGLSCALLWSSAGHGLIWRLANSVGSSLIEARVRLRS
jgi:hypothetical protein